MPKITFMPAQVTVECESGETVFTVGQRHDVGIQTSCVGRATCGLCRVRVLEGEEHLSPLNDHERKHMGNVYYLTKERLSCQAVVQDGAVVVQVQAQERKAAKSKK